MLNGLECNEQHEITPYMEQKAERNLRKFLFVGVTDQYRKGIEAFHIFMKQGTKPSPEEFVVHRPGAYRIEDKLACLQWMQDNGFEDPYDDKIYRVAVEIFEKIVDSIGRGVNADMIGSIKKSSVPVKGKIAPRVRPKNL